MALPQGQSPKVILRTTKIIWAGLALQTFFYGAALFVLEPCWKSEAKDPANRIADGLEAVAAMGGEETSPAALLKYAAFIPGLVALGIFLNALTQEKLEARFSRSNVDRALQSTYVLYLAGWILNSALAMTGFIYVFVVTKEFSTYLPYLGASILLSGVLFPRIDGPLLNALKREGVDVSGK